MLEDPECYYKTIRDHRPDYVIHTAAPFLQNVTKATSESDEKIRKYVHSTKLLAKAACRAGVRKVVMTGAATSVIGKEPKEDGTYENSNDWADEKEETRPNERAKLLAEKSCWNEIL